MTGIVEQERHVAEVLRWAAYPSENEQAPEIPAIDEELLVSRALYHRILAPLLNRLDSHKTSWCPPSLRTRLRFLQHQIRERTRRQMAAASEMSQAMQSAGQPAPIFVKGFAAYALLNRDDFLHFSSDLDPFAEDLPAFWSVLHELGYSGKRKDTHEWAKMSRGGIALDVHEYFPMLAYPAEVIAAGAPDLEAWRNPGHWHLMSLKSDLVPAGDPARWSDLASDAVPGRAPQTASLSFPAPEMLCLLHIAHCFRSSVTRLHYLNPLGGFRLYELMAIHALARLPEFNPARFCELAGRFGVHDGIKLVNALSRFYLGSAAVPVTPLSNQPLQFDEMFPEHLPFGGWVSLQKDDDWAFLRTTEIMFEQMGANDLAASHRSTLDALSRILTYGSPLPKIEIEITWRRDVASLSVEWTILEGQVDAAGYELMVHFGYDSFMRAKILADIDETELIQRSDYWTRGQEGQVKTEHDGFARSRIFMDIPVPSVPLRQADHSILPVLLAVRRVSSKSSENLTEAACYIPVRLHQS